MTRIAKNGSWLSSKRYADLIDQNLATELSKFFQDQSVIDFGCGNGFYVKAINETARCRGYDGNPHTSETGGEHCHVLDLSQPVNVEVADWVLSLEVGEHIPQRFEDTFIGNLHRHNTKGIVLSWAWPGQGGIGHCNEQPQEYVSQRLESLGYRRDAEQEQTFRQVSRFSWFRTNIIVLKRNQS